MATRWTIDKSSHFIRKAGQPWFLLGDTAWSALGRLSAPEAEHYLRTRARQGFNTVLTVALWEYGGPLSPNANGDAPFESPDPGRPNEPYWQHVDWFVRQAGALGLTVALLPVWGRYWSDPEEDSGRPFFDADSAAAYAAWIGARYRDADVIWVLGGDRVIATPEHRAVIDGFATGLRSQVGDGQLITFHPRGHGTSTDALADAEWMDFDMVQSGHTGWDTPNYQMIEQDYRRVSARPVLDSEPNYEAHPVMTPALASTGLWTALEDWIFDDRDVRRAAYHAVFAGACGHVYGCQPVWQFFDPDRGPALHYAPPIPWRTAIELPGARQMGHLASLVRQVDIFAWEPDQSLITSGVGFLSEHQRAMARRDGPGALVYAPGGREVRLDLGRWPVREWSARWWSPRDDTWTEPAQRFTGARFSVASPYHGSGRTAQGADAGGRGDPRENPGNDGVLLVEPVAH